VVLENPEDGVDEELEDGEHGGEGACKEAEGEESEHAEQIEGAEEIHGLIVSYAEQLVEDQEGGEEQHLEEGGESGGRGFTPAVLPVAKVKRQTKQ